MVKNGFRIVKMFTTSRRTGSEMATSKCCHLNMMMMIMVMMMKMMMMTMRMTKMTMIMVVVEMTTSKWCHLIVKKQW